MAGSESSRLQRRTAHNRTAHTITHQDNSNGQLHNSKAMAHKAATDHGQNSVGRAARRLAARSWRRSAATAGPGSSCGISGVLMVADPGLKNYSYNCAIVPVVLLSRLGNCSVMDQPAALCIRSRGSE